MKKLNNIYGICNKIILLTDEEFLEIEELYNSQISHIHPFKHASQKALNELGEYNKSVLLKLKELHQILINHKPQK